MRGGGVILIVIALFTIFLGVSGKFCCFTQFLKCAVTPSLTPCCDCDKQTTNTVSQTTSLIPDLPKIPALPPLNSLG